MQLHSVHVVEVSVGLLGSQNHDLHLAAQNAAGTRAVLNCQGANLSCLLCLASRPLPQWVQGKQSPERTILVAVRPASSSVPKEMGAGSGERDHLHLNLPLRDHLRMLAFDSCSLRSIGRSCASCLVDIETVASAPL